MDQWATHLRSRSGLGLAMLCLVAWCFAPVRAPASDGTTAAAGVADGYLAELGVSNYGLVMAMATENRGVVTIPVELPGVAETGTITVDTQRERVRSLRLPYPCWEFGVAAGSADEVASAATKAVSLFLGEEPAGWALACRGAELADYWGGGLTVRVVYGLRLGGSEAPVWSHWQASVNVALDGSRVLAVSSPFGWPDADATPVAPSADELDAARTYAERFLGRGAGRLLRCDGLGLNGDDPDHPYYEWECVFCRPGPLADFSDGMVAWVWLGSGPALTGEAEGVPAKELARMARRETDPTQDIREALVPTRCVHDTLPSWAGHEQSIACLSVRGRVGAPWWHRIAGALLADPASAPACAVAAWREDLVSLDASCGVVVTTRRSGQLRVVDAGSGDAIELGDWRSQSFREAVLDPSATFIAYTAYRRHGDQDIFIDKIDWNARCTSRHRRIVRVDGPDERPVFSPDGEWVYYAHADDGAAEGAASSAPTVAEEGPIPGPPVPGGAGGGGGAVWSLCRVRADAPHQNTEVEEVLAGFGRVGRMSFFPDGRRLLVWHEGGLDVVDVEARTKEPLGLPDLFDPDLLDGPPLKIQDPVVSPDGTRLAFSGYRDAEASDKLSGWYIYVCNLDGSGLERITPLEDDPVDFYVFPESGKSAFDLEKEMILEREREEAKGR